LTGQAGDWLEADDGLRIYRREWRGTVAARAGLLSIHGLASHSGWIENLAARLSANGIIVHACDLRGHGHTGRVAGQLPGPNRLLADLELAFDALSSAAPDVQRFILGTSLGGCLAISLAARRPDASGLILISPALSPSYLTRLESARIAFDLLRGGRRTVATPRARGLRISGSKEVRDRLDADPLSLSALPSRSHWSALRVIQKAKRDLRRVTAPVLCFQGANDPVVSARFNRSHLEGRRNTRFVWIDEGYHDLALEPEVGGIDRIIEEWIGAQDGGR
jgi:acylglycerol lipase